MERREYLWGGGVVSSLFWQVNYIKKIQKQKGSPDENTFVSTKTLTSIQP